MKEGGVLQQPNREVTIKVKPSDIPETFDIDISKLQIGETITVADIRAKSKYEILNEDDHALVLISSPRTQAEMEELESEAAETAEPEVIGEKKRRRRVIQNMSARIIRALLFCFNSSIVIKGR